MVSFWQPKTFTVKKQYFPKIFWVPIRSHVLLRNPMTHNYEIVHAWSPLQLEDLYGNYFAKSKTKFEKSQSAEGQFLLVKGVTVRLCECSCALFRFLKFCVPLSHSKSAHPAKLTVQSQNRLSFKMGLFTTSLVAIEILLAFSTSGQDSGFDNNEMQCLKTLPPREGSLIGQVRNMGWMKNLWKNKN